MPDTKDRSAAAPARARWLRVFHDFTSAWMLVLAAVIAALLTVRLMAPLVVPSRTPAIELMTGSDSQTLVVAVHGFGGAASRNGLLTLAHTAYPGAHLIAPAYLSGRLAPFSNQSPHDLADLLETTIDDAHRRFNYQRIVLIGHSMGGEILRKVFVWGSGLEEDRPGSRRGRHAWVDRVDRFVSLASINRGWSIDPAPRQMTWARRLTFRAGIRLAKLTGTGRLILDMQRGAPFVADLRVQWIRLARSGATAAPKVPFVIHLLGTVDDIATHEDVKDAQAAKDFKFKSLPNTGHGDIAESLATELREGQAHSARARAILDAVKLPPDQIVTDQPDPLIEQTAIKRVVFILHGIRDYDYWGKELEQRINAAQPADTAVVVPKYGHFPMMPFLLWGDRQEKVRWFMDVYTETLAQYPYAGSLNFIGHSNGTYILASALQQYRTLKVDDLYFAGSVVPQRYPWADLISQGRVRRVRNVVATSDWVVAIFPRLYEQVAEWWFRSSPPTGRLDIGAAGFRGFRFHGSPSNAVLDFTFARGAHSTGVDIRNERKLQALIRFARYGADDQQDEEFRRAFDDADDQDRLIDIVSNVSWLVWLALIGVAGGLGALAWKRHPAAGVAYLIVLIGLLNSV